MNRRAQHREPVLSVNRRGDNTEALAYLVGLRVMKVSHAESYRDDGTPAEQSRRTFMVQATLALGGVIGLGIAIPVVTSLVPSRDALAAKWSPLSAQEFAQLEKATQEPIKVSFAVKDQDGYLPAATSDEFVWAIRADEATMRAKRPKLFSGPDKVDYPVVTMGFVIFSPICPHLGCRYDWRAELHKFVCPCHGSQYTNLGVHTAGPAQRGLDPLPLRERSGTAELTWIQYEQDVADRVVLSYEA
jgi:menaquinol-cytochrome c reductase iron-sulfur subunit